MTERTRFTPYILGHKQMDEEHKTIYDALESMYRNIPPETLEEQIRSAAAVCRAHFHHEIELMESVNYPYIASHKAVHAVTESKFADFFKHPSPELKEEVIRDLLHHVDWYDRPFVQFMKGCSLMSKKDDS